MSYPHHNPWFAPSSTPVTGPSPRQVETLARAVLERERLSLHDLPRCRREVRMQLALTLTALRPRVHTSGNSHDEVAASAGSG